LTCHWKEGVSPPFVGVAVKVTAVPAQTVVASAVIETLTGKLALTVMVNGIGCSRATGSTGFTGGEDNSYLVVVERGVGEAGTVGSLIYSIDLPLIRRR